MKRSPLVFYAISGLIFVAGFLLPRSPWVGWTALALICGAALWLFRDAAGLLSVRYRWLTLGEHVTYGMLLLGFSLWPGHAFAVFAVFMLVMMVLRLAKRTSTPTGRPPLG